MSDEIPKNGHADQEQPLAPEQIRDPTEEQSEASRAQGETSGNPLQVGQREPDVGTDGGKRDIQDGKVDGQSERGREKHREN